MVSFDICGVTYDTFVFFFQVKLVRLVGIMLIVYVKKELWKNITLVDSESVPTGIMGIMVSVVNVCSLHAAL